MREVLGRIQHASDAISTATQEIVAGNQDLSGHTEEQASHLEETSSSMEILNEAVRKNADGTQKASELSSQSNEVTNRGGLMVQKVVCTMNESTQQNAALVEQAAAAAESLEDQAVRMFRLENPKGASPLHWVNGSWAIRCKSSIPARRADGSIDRATARAGDAKGMIIELFRCTAQKYAAVPQKS